jgi:protein phosphatase 1L
LRTSDPAAAAIDLILKLYPTSVDLDQYVLSGGDMLLHSVRFICSVAAAFVRLVRELRKALAMAVSAHSPVISIRHAAAAASPIGRIAASPLSLRRDKQATSVAVQEQVMVAPLPPPATFVPAPPCDVATGRGAEERRQADNSHSQNQKRKAAWAAKKRPSRLVIPVTDDADEVAAGWGAAAASEAADVEVEGEGFCLASKAGPRHAMEDGYAVVTDKNGDSELVNFLLYVTKKRSPPFYGTFNLLS